MEDSQGGAVTLPVVGVLEADAYMAQTLKADDWSSLSTEVRQRALNSASAALGTLCWRENSDCCGRELVPSYTAAISELALAMAADGKPIFGAASQMPTPVVKSQQFAVFKEEFFAPSETLKILPSDKRVNSRSPTVLRLYPWLLDLIECWITYDNSSAIPLYRS